jgi:hypothetical protein
MQIISRMRQLQQAVPAYIQEGRTAQPKLNAAMLEAIIEMMDDLESVVDAGIISSTIEPNAMGDCLLRICNIIDLLPMEAMLSREVSATNKLYYDGCTTIFGLLDRFIVYTSREYPAYFNHEQFIPNNFRLRYQHRFQNDIMILRTWMQYANEDLTALSAIILDTFAYIEPGREPKPTFDSLMFVTEMRTILTELWIKYGSDITEVQLSDALVCLNLNTRVFIDYYCHKIDVTFHSQPTKEQQFNALIRAQEHLFALPEHPAMYFNITKPSAKETLMKWLNDKIDVFQLD